MGVVYKALDPLIERTVALKSVGMGMSQDEAEVFERRFYREAKSAGRLNHPNIVTIYDVGKSGDHAYIAMELLEGQSLRDILDSGVVLPPEKVADIAAQIADGLAFAHQNDIVHRDIKPANIMVLNHGVVKITDFGIALLPTGSRTMAGTVFGSPKYISPEQIVGKEVDGRSDIFALGAVVYEMLTGVPPFTGADLSAILYQVINEMPASPTTRNRNIAPAFDRIVAKAMAKNPDDRYQKVQDMAADLRNYQRLDSSGGVQAKSSRSMDRRTKRKPSPPPPNDGTTQMMDAPTTIMMMHDDLPPVTSSRKSRRKDLFQRKGFLYGVPAVLLTLFFIGFLLQINRSRHKAVEQTVSTVSSTTAPASPADETATAEKSPSITSIPTEAKKSLEPAAEKLSSGGIGDAAPHKSTEPAVTEEAKKIEESNKAAPAAGTSKNVAKKSNATDHANSNAEPSHAGSSEKKKPATKTTAVVNLAVTPWGEIYVDGKQQGISPPLRELSLPLGKHIIEIRNTGFPIYQETINVSATASLKVKHKFQ